MRTLIYFWCIVLPVVFCGCGSGDKLKTYHVTGKVTFADGKPLAGGLVTFQSVEHKVSACGVIESDGTCRLGTYQTDDGVVAGRHQVAISAPIRRPIAKSALDERMPANLRKIDPKYKNPGTSGLEFNVTPGGPNEFDFQVTP